MCVYNDIEKKINNIVKHIVNENKDIDFFISLQDYYQFDSVEYMILLIELNNSFNIEIDDKDFTSENFQNINSIVKIIKEYLKKK